METPRDSSDIQIATACQICSGNGGIGSRTRDGGNPHQPCDACEGSGWTLKRPAELTFKEIARLVQRLPQLAPHEPRNSPPPTSIIGSIVEAGDDEAGQPRLTIHTTREELKRIALIQFYRQARINFTPIP